jgi:novobiocin biosynthesis protein NovU/D-mycarose 3-C-methyltransferase
VPPDFLFNIYNYESSTTETLRDHFQQLALDIDMMGAKSVLEIGCNDGVLLSPLQKRGIKVLGVDPATNIASKALEKGVEVIPAFFTNALARQIVITYGQFDIVTGSNVFAHIDDMDGVLEGISTVLKNEGSLIFEVHDASALLKTLQYDSIYHEHVSYFTEETAKTLLARNGFKVYHTIRTRMHGGGLRLYAKKCVPFTLIYTNNEEEATEFGLRVAWHKKLLQSLLKEAGRTVGYGAPGRGNTLLNYCEITIEQIEYITDASSLRYNKFTPGTHIPIYSESERPLISSGANSALILAWTYISEIMKKESGYLDKGGKFIVPFPLPKVVKG